MPRHPSHDSSAAEAGQPTVLAKPAISVMPVMLRRACAPWSRTRVANADSYSPPPIPSPSSSQASQSTATSGAKASISSPMAKTPLLAIRTGRPPQRSIHAPMRGPTRAETTNAPLKAAMTPATEVPRSRAMGTARMAGR